MPDEIYNIDDNITAIRLGSKAYTLGVSDDENPFSPDDQRFDYWIIGWNTASISSLVKGNYISDRVYSGIKYKY